jgi:hypothetical protein
MSNKYRILAAAMLLPLLLIRPSLAVETRIIEQVREKGVLDSSDLQLIDEFVDRAVDELINTTDFTSVEKTRRDIVTNASSSTDSAKAQYAQQFALSALKYIEQGIKETEQIADADTSFRVTINLLILIDSLENTKLAPLAIKMLNDKRKSIQYWAVHSLTNPGIIKQLNSSNTDELTLAKQIAESLDQFLNNADEPETTALIALYASQIAIPQAEQLLIKIADIRIKKYLNWTVQNELLDSEILLSIYEKLSSKATISPQLLRSFAQLYSCIFQRYIKAEAFLPDSDIEQMESVLTEVEQSCISKMLQIPQSVIKKAIENEDIPALQAEHDRLLGSPQATGKLNDVVKFSYGKTEKGDPRTWPLTLPETPAEIISK